MEACRYIYDPTRESEHFVVCFDQDERKLQGERSQKVIAHLETLGQDDLNEESVLFFKWVVLHHLGGCNRFYAQGRTCWNSSDNRSKGTLISSL